MFTDRKCRSQLVSSVLVVPLLIGLSGCKHRHHADEQRPADTPGMQSDMIAPASMVMSAAMSRNMGARQGSNAKIAYSHFLTFEVPLPLLRAHFDHMQDFCSAMAGCTLQSAVEERAGENDPDTGRTSSLDVRVPHDKVASFLATAAAPLPGESAVGIVPVRQRTMATDLGHEVADVDRRLQQLTAYRDRLEALEGQGAGHVDDLVKIAKELSEAQSELDSTRTENNRLQNMIDTDEVHLTYESRPPQSGPLRRVWRGLGRTFMESIADTLQSLIEAVVWLPIVVPGLFLLSLALRRGWFRSK